MTLPELTVGLLIAAVALLVGTLVAVPWLARESARSALHDTATMLQLARVEALSRNHACAFLVDLDAREISVVDTNGTVTDTDDVVLQARRLPTTVSVARPDGGSAITFESVGGSLYRVQFDADGHVTSGTGELVLYGGEHYGRVIIYSAGGVRHQRWNGSSWIAGA